MKHRFFPLLTLACMVQACEMDTSIIWIEGDNFQDNGSAVHTVLVCNPPSGMDWEVWGSYYPAKPKPLESKECRLELFNTSYCVITPLVSGKDTLSISYSSSPLTRYSFMPEGFSLHRPGHKDKHLKVEYRVLDEPVEAYDNFTWHREPLDVKDMIPSLKSVKALEGTADAGTVKILRLSGHEAGECRHGWYRLTLDDRGALIESADDDGLFYARNTLDRLKENAGGSTVPAMVIEDWPDFGLRGFMMDTARSFYSKEQVFSVLDMMARYKLNLFQFHLSDDEGWRIEVEGIPELTSFGAFHALPVRQEDGSYLEVNGLHPSYDGSCDRNDKWSIAHGFFTRSDFIEILRYAADRHIKVVPEIDTPGHSYAAISAMEAYWRRTGDDSLRLVDPDEQAAFLSSTGRRNNVLNVVRPQTYKFIGMVIDALASMYEEAGMKLTEIHLGGDEVADGSWTGMPSCVEFMEKNGWTEEYQLKEYYLGKLMDMLEPHGIKLDGWQEITFNLSPEARERLIRNAGYINVWSTNGKEAELPYLLANDGYPVLLCGAKTNYMDLAYNANRSERGLNWGGYVDEHVTFSLLPYDLDCDTVLERPENLVGTEALLWSEQLRSMDMFMYALMPKSLGVFDRAWNTTPDMSFDRFYSIVADRELPYLDSMGLNHRRAASPVEQAGDDVR